VLRHEQDAEDAFQAAFLVLARKAASLRPQRSLGGWLHEVAYHLALRAREKTARRQRNEKEVRPMTPSEEPALEASRHELRSLLDEELWQLPAKYREPLVLCYLEGKTNEQAARQLGWPAGSMSRRLQRGRELLRRRLRRRGVSLTAGVLTTALVEEASAAAVPPLLAASVVRMVLQTSVAGIPASVAALVEGRIQEMFLVKPRLARFVTLIGVGVGAAALAYQTKEAKVCHENVSSPAKTTQPRILTDLYGDPLPPGALMRLGTVRLRHIVPRIAFSIDGKRLLSFSVRDKIVRHWDPISGRELRHVSLQGAEQLKLPTECAWAGKTVAIWNGEHLALWDATTGRECRRIDMGKKRIHTLALSPSRETMAVAIETIASKGIQLWDAASGKKLLFLELP
jgi:RNA polymerase sigma factor (sigma-70 family)